MRSAAHPHRHFGLDAQGHPAIIETLGNPDTHLVLRGGHKGPNYDALALPLLACSHGSMAARTQRASLRCSMRCWRNA